LLNGGHEMDKKIVVFTSDTCGYCHMVKDYLNENNITFEERNVSSDKEARKELMSKGFMGVPVIYIDDEIIQGFDKNKLDELLK
jgi:glutaredoxin-like YruB-family protein